MTDAPKDYFLMYNPHKKEIQLWNNAEPIVRVAYHPELRPTDTYHPLLEAMMLERKKGDIKVHLIPGIPNEEKIMQDLEGVLNG